MNRPRCAAAHHADATIHCELVVGHGASHYHFDATHVLSKWRDQVPTLPSQRSPGAHVGVVVVAAQAPGTPAVDSTPEERAVETTPVETTPVETTPVETTPAETAEPRHQHREPPAPAQAREPLHAPAQQPVASRWVGEDDVPPVAASKILGAWGRTAS